MVVNWFVLVIVINVIEPLAATVCPNVLKLLLLTFKVLVALAAFAKTVIPTMAPEANPL